MGANYTTVDEVGDLLSQNPFTRETTAWVAWKYGAMVGVNKGCDAGIKVFQNLVAEQLGTVTSHAVLADLRDAYKLGLEVGKEYIAPAFTAGNGRFRTDEYTGSDQCYQEVMSEMAECRIAKLPLNSEHRLWARY